MDKKCYICDEQALYRIKEVNGFYCKECAQELFSDINLLIKIEKEAQILKKYLNKKMESE
jgi:hypothetical protein